MEKKLRIGIVGLGLIGGSIEKRLAGKYELLCVSASQGREHKLEDLIDVDIVFLCGSQSTILKQLGQIAQIISRSGAEGSIKEEYRAFSRTIITDVASTKLEISKTAQELGLKNFIAGHPMAGTEHQGYEASFLELFEGAKWVLEESNALLETVIKELGAEVVILDSETHDKAVAMTSHLPLVLSVGLAEMVSNYSPATKVIGPGFKSMTRLAKGNANMGKEIISLNRKNIRDAWKVYKQEVESILNIYGADLESELTQVKEAATGF